MKHNFKYIIIIIALIIGFFLFVQTTVDDAFICFRYGYNLINNGIWNWNINNEKAEAYTSFSYMMLSVFPSLLNIQPHLFFKAFTFLVLLLLCYRLYINNSNKFGIFFVLLFIVANWQTHVHIYACLETLFLVFLITETLLQLNKEKINQIILWFLALLLPLTRPEAVAFSFLIFLYIVFIKKEKIHTKSFLFFVCLGFVYYAWRFFYFGLPFPLSFYHKSVSGNMGWIGVIYNTYTSWQYILLAIALFFLVERHKLAKYSLITSLLIYYLLYSTSTLLMNYANRFAFQIFMPSILFSLFIIIQLYPEKIKEAGIFSCFFVLAISYKGVFDKMPLAFFEASTISVNYKASYVYQYSYYNIGKHLQKIENRENLKILSGDAGIIPYLSNAKCYDFNGLANKHLSRKIIDKSYFDEINADLIIIGPAPNIDFAVDSLKNIKQSMVQTLYLTEKSDRYTRLSKTIPFYSDAIHFIFYVKKESLYKKDLEHQLSKAILFSENFKPTPKDFLTFKYLMY